MRMILMAIVLGLSGVPLASRTWAATWYVGAFTQCGGVACTGARAPADDATCGLVASPPTGSQHPCLTIAWFQASGGRNNPPAAGDTIYGTGTMAACGANCVAHCIFPKRANLHYEGRTAADAATIAHDAWVIDAANTLTTGVICQGGALVCEDINGCTANGLTVTSMSFNNSIGNAGAGNFLQPVTGHTWSNITIQHATFDSNYGPGLKIGQTSTNTEDSPCGGVWNTTNVTLSDLLLTNNTRGKGSGVAGLQFGCVDGATINTVTIADTVGRHCTGDVGTACNTTAADCVTAGGTCVEGVHSICINGVHGQKFCNKNASANIGLYCKVDADCGGVAGSCVVSSSSDFTVAGCNDHDGMQCGGMKNATLTRLSVTRSGEDNIDCGGTGNPVCDAPSFNVVIDQFDASDASDGNFKLNHCTHDNRASNGFIWGGGTGMAFYSCPYANKIQGNTVWMQKVCTSGTNAGTICTVDGDCTNGQTGACASGFAFRLYEGAVNYNVSDNIFHCDTAGGVACVESDKVATDPSTVWVANVVHNASGSAFNEILGGACNDPYPTPTSALTGLVGAGGGALVSGDTYTITYSFRHNFTGYQVTKVGYTLARTTTQSVVLGGADTAITGTIPIMPAGSCTNDVTPVCRVEVFLCDNTAVPGCAVTGGGAGGTNITTSLSATTAFTVTAVGAVAKPAVNQTAGCSKCAFDLTLEPQAAPTHPLLGTTPASLPYASTGAGLTAFKTACDAGTLFGTCGASAPTPDKWGTNPTVVATAPLSVANLHLQVGDAIAKDAGATLAGFASDYDGGTRPQGPAWDIGADEVGASLASNSVCNPLQHCTWGPLGTSTIGPLTNNTP